MFLGKKGFKKQSNSLFILLFLYSVFPHAASSSPDSSLTLKLTGLRPGKIEQFASDLSVTVKSNGRQGCYQLFLDQDKLLELWEKADEFEERINDLTESHSLRDRVMGFCNEVKQIIEGTTGIFPEGYRVLKAEADLLESFLQDTQSNLSQISIDELKQTEPFYMRRFFIENRKIPVNKKRQSEKQHRDKSTVISDKSSFEQLMTDPTLLKPGIRYNLDLPPGPVHQVVFSDRIAKALTGKNKASRFISQYAVSFLRAIGRGLVGSNGDNGIKRLKGSNNLYEVKLIGKSKGRLRLVGFLHESTFYITEYFKDSNHSGKAFQSILESIKRKADEFSGGALPVVH